jgi:hypothetical protein
VNEQRYSRQAMTVQLPPRTEVRIWWFARRAVFFAGGALLGLVGGLLVPAVAARLGVDMSRQATAAAVAPATPFTATAPTVTRPVNAVAASSSAETTRLLDPTFTVDVSQLPKAPVEVASVKRTNRAPRTAHTTRPTRIAHAAVAQAYDTNAFDDALVAGR